MKRFIWRTLSKMPILHLNKLKKPYMPYLDRQFQSIKRRFIRERRFIHTKINFNKVMKQLKTRFRKNQFIQEALHQLKYKCLQFLPIIHKVSKFSYQWRSKVNYQWRNKASFQWRSKASYQWRSKASFQKKYQVRIIATSIELMFVHVLLRTEPLLERVRVNVALRH